MARAQHPDSAGSQFFVMHDVAEYLDGQYAAFGRVIEGMEVVDEIANCKTDWYDRPYEDQVMAKVTAESFGVTYPAPIKG
jgi:peptidyl-prolyl cis-trans isomerase B (cyclophilin B)